MIHAGARKVDANPYPAETVRTRIDGELEDLRRLFVETIAEGRGRTHSAGTDEAVHSVSHPVWHVADGAAQPRRSTSRSDAVPRSLAHADRDGIPQFAWTELGR